MSDLQELYQQIIVDHSKRPRNFKRLEGANRLADGFNPLCGDKITVFLKITGDQVEEATFQGSGCAISTASASMMTDAMRGKTLAQAEALFKGFHEMVTGVGEPDRSALGKLAVFAGVCEFPARVKCASLAWHTLNNALHNEPDVAKTE